MYRHAFAVRSVTTVGDFRGQTSLNRPYFKTLRFHRAEFQDVPSSYSVSANHEHDATCNLGRLLN